MDSKIIENSNPFALLHYVVAGVHTYYLMLKEQVARLRERYSIVNITNTDDIQIINMPGEPPGPENEQFIIVTSNSPPPDDDADAGRIRIVHVSAVSQVDNTVSLIRRMSLLVGMLDENTLNEYVYKVISVIGKTKKGGRIRRSSSTCRAAKKRASTRRRGRSAKKRATRRRAH